MFTNDESIPAQHHAQEHPVKPVQQWWNRTYNTARHFFDLVRLPALDLAPVEADGLLDETRAAYHALDHADYPHFARDARFCLLTAINDTITALTLQLSGQVEAANAYLESARIELEFLYNELDALDVHLNVDHLLHH